MKVKMTQEQVVGHLLLLTGQGPTLVSRPAPVEVRPVRNRTGGHHAMKRYRTSYGRDLAQ